MNVSKLKPLTNSMLEELGLEWHTDLDNSDYITNEVVEITQAEADAFYDAGNELYEMFIEAGEYVIKNNLFFDLDIPPTLIDTIKQSWDNEVHWHIYGRFDFAGGLDGKPIKLLEFNADTPTLLYESALIQWALLKHNSLDEEMQFNNIFNAISDNFKRMITLGDDVSRFDTMYEGWGVLFSSIRGNIEEERTTKFLMECAKEAGFVSEFCYIDEINFNEDEGVSFNGSKYEFLFKLLPWEIISIDEPELALIINNMMKNKNKEFYLHYNDNNTEIKLQNLSAGLKSFVIIKRLLENGSLNEKDVLILDEPEIHLHPKWQLIYAELIVLLQKYFNLTITITTHSHYFLEAINRFSKRHNIDERVNFYITELSENQSNVIFKNVNDNLDIIYEKMYEPLEILSNMREEQDNEKNNP